MAYRRRPSGRRRVKRRRFRRPMRRRFRKRSITNSQRLLKFNGVGFPSAYMTCLRYVGKFAYPNNTLGNFTTPSVVSLAADCFSPIYNFSGGHQPYYYDQLSNLYQKYQVFAMKVKLTFTNVDVADSIVCGYTWTDNVPNVPATDVRWAVEANQWGRWKTCPPAPAGGRASFSTYMTAKNIHGMNRTSQQIDQQTFTTQSAADRYFCNCWVGPQVDGITISGAVVDYAIKFYVKFYESNYPGISYDVNEPGLPMDLPFYPNSGTGPDWGPTGRHDINLL